MATISADPAYVAHLDPKTPIVCPEGHSSQVERMQVRESYTIYREVLGYDPSTEEYVYTGADDVDYESGVTFAVDNQNVVLCAACAETVGSDEDAEFLWTPPLTPAPAAEQTFDAKCATEQKRGLELLDALSARIGQELIHESMQIAVEAIRDLRVLFGQADAPVQLIFDDGTPIYCEWTPDGPDKTLRFACNDPATVEVPDADGIDTAWYCPKHSNTPPFAVSR